MNWSEAHIKKLKEEGKIVDYKIIGNQSSEVKKSKHGNKKIVADGITFDSKKEYCRYKDLQFLQSIGEISELRRQVTFHLGVCKYIADHVYKDKNGDEIVEDVKSKHTRTLSTYRLKMKLMKERLGITIKEY